MSLRGVLFVGTWAVLLVWLPALGSAVPHLAVLYEIGCGSMRGGIQ
jgi:membrane protein YqaA with SNARE-associated domain